MVLTVKPSIASLSRSLSKIHRWLGIVMCLFFGMWFASGALMLFVPFPALDETRRLAAMPPIDVASIRLSPADAVARSGVGPDRLEAMRLIEGPEGPVYLLQPRAGRFTAVSAMDGRVLPATTAVAARWRARALVGGEISAVSGPFHDDQWIVTQKFDPYRPFLRVDFADAAGSSVYVSTRTGEALQRTTRLQRLANYPGSIVHWIYPTILRRYPTVWSYTVWAISLVGIAMALAGLVLGCTRSWTSLRNARRPGISPFRRLFRLHHLLGLGGGLFLLTWIFSGWLSVDHGILFPTGKPTESQTDAFRGETLGQAAGQIRLADLALARGQASLEIDAVHGLPVLTGYGSGTGSPTTRLFLDGAWGDLGPSTLLLAVRSAWPASHPIAAAITPQDDYAHLLYDGLPDDALRFKLGDRAATWVHVSASTGRIIDVQDWRRRLYRWLFNGLHTFDIPGLGSHELLRKLIMLPLLGAGFLLSVTGIVLAKRRLSRMAGRRPPGGTQLPTTSNASVIGAAKTIA